MDVRRHCIRFIVLSVAAFAADAHGQSAPCGGPREPACDFAIIVPSLPERVEVVVCVLPTRAYCEMPSGSETGKPCECPGGQHGTSRTREVSFRGWDSGPNG